MIQINNLYEMLALVEDADTYDNVFDSGVCWSQHDGKTDDKEAYDLCMDAIQKRIDILKFSHASYGFNLIADISGFVKQHMGLLHRVSQEHKWPMRSTDPDEDEDVYLGVKLLEALEIGEASEDEYVYLLMNLEPEIFQKWKTLSRDKWIDENEGYFDSMIPEVVKIMTE